MGWRGRSGGGGGGEAKRRGGVGDLGISGPRERDVYVFRDRVCMRLAHCGRTIGSARMDGRMERRRSSDAAPVHKIGGGFFFL